MVDIDLAYEMIALMLDDAGKKAGEITFLRLKILIEPGHMYLVGTLHRLREPGKRETSLLVAHRLRIFGRGDLGIDQTHTGVGTLRIMLGKSRAVEHYEPDGLTHLRSGQAHTLGMLHGLPHVGYERAELIIIVFGRKRLGCRAEHRMTVKIDWK